VATTKHMKKFGLLDETQEKISNETRINFLMQNALRLIPVLTFIYLNNAYRWKIIDGAIGQDNLTYWWVKMTSDIQGLVPPVLRDENDLDFGVTYGLKGETHKFIKH